MILELKNIQSSFALWFHSYTLVSLKIWQIIRISQWNHFTILFENIMHSCIEQSVNKLQTTAKYQLNFPPHSHWSIFIGIGIDTDWTVPMDGLPSSCVNSRTNCVCVVLNNSRKIPICIPSWYLKMNFFKLENCNRSSTAFFSGIQIVLNSSVSMFGKHCAHSWKSIESFSITKCRTCGRPIKPCDEQIHSFLRLQKWSLILFK